MGLAVRDAFCATAGPGAEIRLINAAVMPAARICFMFIRFIPATERQIARRSYDAMLLANASRSAFNRFLWVSVMP